MDDFRIDNTEGYTQEQLDEMNRRLVEAMEGQDEDDMNYSDNLKHAAERIQKEYDTELAAEKHRPESVVVSDWRDYLTSELTDEQEKSLKKDWIDENDNLVLIDEAGVDYSKEFWTQWQGIFDEIILK